MLDNPRMAKILDELLGVIGNPPEEERRGGLFHEKAVHEKTTKKSGKEGGKSSQVETQSPVLRDEDITDRLDRLRLLLKYLIFDLGATRRENAQLRKMLDDNNYEGA